MRNDTNVTTGRIYFITSTNGTYNETNAKSFSIVANSPLQEYTIDMSTVSGWTGTIRQIRIDPPGTAAGIKTTIDYVRISN